MKKNVPPYCASSSSGRHIAIDSSLLILSFELKFFACRHVSICGFWNRVCPYPEKRNHHSFVNITPALVVKVFSTRATEWKPKNLILFKKNMVTRVFLLSCYPLTFMWVSTYICVNYMHIMFRQVCTFEPSFFKTTSGMRRSLFESRHLVLQYVVVYSSRHQSFFVLI